MDETERTITLIEERIGSEYHFLGARLLANGDLIVEGQDIGNIPEQFFGEREYEYQYSIAAEHVPTLLLRLLKDRFTEKNSTLTGFASSSDFHQWLEAQKIPSHFMAY